MNVKIDINDTQVINKVKNSRFGLFLSTEWKRLIDPYTPRDTGNLQGNVSLQPFKIHYKSPYATYPYHGRGMNFQKKIRIRRLNGTRRRQAQDKLTSSAVRLMPR